jgi:acetyl-CoA carboxylase carboxyl transferase subunit alpha
MLFILQYATYSSFTGLCITCGKADKAQEAAEIMGIFAVPSVLSLIDSIIPEPIGGAHRDYTVIMHSVSTVLQESLRKLQDLSTDTLLEKRHERLMAYGSFKET